MLSVLKFVFPPYQTMFSINWHQKFTDIVIYAATNPAQFFLTIIICLSPFFVLSSYLAYRLAKQIEREETLKQKKQTKITKIQKRTKRD